MHCYMSLTRNKTIVTKSSNVNYFNFKYFHILLICVKMAFVMTRYNTIFLKKLRIQYVFLELFLSSLYTFVTKFEDGFSVQV
jgi:hypothetical protein